MDKRTLSKIPYDWITVSKAKGINWLIEAKEVAGILMINAYPGNKVKRTETKVSFRIFISADDYITQDCRSANVKWRTGRIDNVLGLGCYYCLNTSKIIDNNSKEIIEKRFGKSPDVKGELIKNKSYWYLPIFKWQQSILEKRLYEKHNKELIHTDQLQQLVPDLPQDFENWCYEEGLYNSRYLIYNPPKRKMTNAFCTHCRSIFQIDSKKYHLKRNERGICPECNSEVTFMPQSASIGERYGEDSNWVCIMQKIEGGFVARYFHVGVRKVWRR